jgi:hypothetical protein
MASQNDNRISILKALSFKWSMVPPGASWVLASPKGARFVVESDSIGMPTLTQEVLDALAEGSGERTGQYPTQAFANPRPAPSQKPQ